MFSGQLKNASDVSLSLETFADELPGLITIRKPKPAHKGRVLKKCSVSIASVKRLSSLFTPPVDKSCALHVTSEIQRRRWVPVRELSEGQEIAIMTSELNVQDDGKQFGLDQALVFEEIVSIENTGVQHTYDIEVEGTHNFVAGHLINTKTGEPLTPEEEDKVLNENGHDVENMKFNNWLVPSEYTTTEDGIVFGGIVAHNTAFFNQASTTLFSANQAWFGGTATSSFSSAGALTLITPLLVGSGGTGAATLTGLLQGNGTSAITGITGTAGQFPDYNGTNTLLATSSIYLATSGSIGMGTTTPVAGSGLIVVDATGNFINRIGGTNFITRYTSVCAGCGPDMSFFRGRNTAAAPSAVVNGDVLGGFYFRGHDGVNGEYGAAEIGSS